MKKHNPTQQQTGLFWLASYPKSGNTWLRAFIMSNLKNSSSEDDSITIDINRLNTGAIASSRSLIDNSLGFNTTDLSFDEIDLLRHDAYSWFSNSFLTKVAYHKIHDAYTFSKNGKPVIPSHEVLGTLYIVRNPLDVCVSLANHLNVTIKRSVEFINDPDFVFADNNYSIAPQVRHWLLSWSDHYKSWSQISSTNYLLVRYEDMKQTPLKTFQKISKFLLLPSDKKSVQSALDKVSFERLKKQELEYGFKERPDDTKKFFRKGIVGDWQTELNQSQIDRIIEDHFDVMLELGYINKSGKPTELITKN